MLQGTVLYNYKLTMDNKKSFGFYLLISFKKKIFLHFISVRHISLHIMYRYSIYFELKTKKNYLSLCFPCQKGIEKPGLK